MFIVHADSVFQVPEGEAPNYQSNNPLTLLLRLVEGFELAAERELYLPDSLQYLVPIDFLELYGPSGADSSVLDPRVQDNKLDFQKQNVRRFRTADTVLARGWVDAGGRVVPFLRLSYRGGPDSVLSKATGHDLRETIRLWLKVGSADVGAPIAVPYNDSTDRYEIEIWGDPGIDVQTVLGAKGAAALDAGSLLVRGDLIRGALADFQRETVGENADMRSVVPACTMHPLLPLHIEVAWANDSLDVWDSDGGRNHQLEFNMMLRGWDHHLAAGVSPNPHGGLGFLEYFNLMSNYGRYRTGAADTPTEVGRVIEPWMFDAYGFKPASTKIEDFFAVDYFDLHILKPRCGIGLHRHRDNQEAFFMLDGLGYMVVGDWCQVPGRARCFEIRMLRSGHLAMLKGGQLHALMNATDENVTIATFGGYD